MTDADALVMGGIQTRDMPGDMPREQTVTA